MVLGVWPRRREDLLAPFGSNGRFHDLIVESCEIAPLADAAWADYQRDGKLADLVNKHAAFYRATFAPSLASALRLAHEPETCRAFSESLEHKLKRRLMDEPAPINSLVATIVLAKLEREACEIAVATTFRNRTCRVRVACCESRSHTLGPSRLLPPLS